LSPQDNGREQPWSDEVANAGRIVLLTSNPISEAIVTIAGALGRRTQLMTEDDAGRAPAVLAELDLGAKDAVVICDHDAPDAPATLRAALTGEAGYVAMMASRRRSEGLLAELEGEGLGERLDRLHVPAGLNIGGKSPGEIALTVVAEIVAVGHDRPGGPMKG
jgi:xanthine dehydrogenase accessory factor